MNRSVRALFIALFFLGASVSVSANVSAIPVSANASPIPTASQLNSDTEDAIPQHALPARYGYDGGLPYYHGTIASYDVCVQRGNGFLYASFWADYDCWFNPYTYSFDLYYSLYE